MTGTVTKKASFINEVFSDIDAVFAVKGGFPDASSGAVDASSLDIVEFPCERGSFNYTGGDATINHFKVHGLNADWAQTFIPGDGQVSMNVPTYGTNILELVYGKTGADLTLTLPAGVAEKTSFKGKSFSYEQKQVTLGILVLNGTGDKALYIKKVTFVATPKMDNENNPLYVTLTGTMSAATDVDATAVLEAQGS